jgi:ketopantoate hydroxymethyltransferase
VKRYDEIGARIRDAVGRYVADVKGGAFPGPEHSYRDVPDEGETRSP